jgi:hypothetical protein
MPALTGLEIRVKASMPLQIPPPPQGFLQGLNLSGMRNPGMQEKSWFMVSRVPYLF